MHCVHAVPTEAKRGRQPSGTELMLLCTLCACSAHRGQKGSSALWNWTYRQPWVTLWVVATETGHTAGAVGAPLQAISLAQQRHFQHVYFQSSVCWPTFILPFSRGKGFLLSVFGWKQVALFEMNGEILSWPLGSFCSPGQRKNLFPNVPQHKNCKHLTCTLQFLSNLWKLKLFRDLSQK